SLAADLCCLGVTELVGMPVRYDHLVRGDRWVFRVGIRVCPPAGRSDGPSIAGHRVAFTRSLLWLSLPAVLLARSGLRLALGTLLRAKRHHRLGWREHVGLQICLEERLDDFLCPGADGDDPVMATPGRLVLSVWPTIAAGSIEPNPARHVQV